MYEKIKIAKTGLINIEYQIFSKRSLLSYNISMRLRKKFEKTYLSIQFIALVNNLK